MTTYEIIDDYLCFAGERLSKHDVWFIITMRNKSIDNDLLWKHLANVKRKN